MVVQIHPDDAFGQQMLKNLEVYLRPLLKSTYLFVRCGRLSIYELLSDITEITTSLVFVHSQFGSRVLVITVSCAFAEPWLPSLRTS